MSKGLNYIDLFAGAGGLSEGFKRAGFNPIAHVEFDKAACYTLQTRTAYYFLTENKQFDTYISYLKGEITRAQLYSVIPQELLTSVINHPIGLQYNETIFKEIEKCAEGKEIDLIVGGPPCQAYSLVGRSRHDMSKDPRNYLFLEYAKYLERYKPKLFVFENVIGLKSANEGRYFKSMLTVFRNLGYEVADFVFKADKFNVLQKRKRVVLIGYQRELNLSLPDFEPSKANEYTVSVLFEDLPELQAGQGIDKFSKYTNGCNDYLKETRLRNGLNVLTQHVCRSHTEQDKEIYRIAVDLWFSKQERLAYNNLPANLKTHTNQSSFYDRFKVVASDLSSSQTVVAHISKDGHYYIHPDINQNRSISIREAARLQSFPDDFYFEGVKESANRTASYKQIGNAVPPLMAWAIANKISDVL